MTFVQPTITIWTVTLYYQNPGHRPQYAAEVANNTESDYRVHTIADPDIRYDYAAKMQQHHRSVRVHLWQCRRQVKGQMSEVALAAVLASTAHPVSARAHL